MLSRRQFLSSAAAAAAAVSFSNLAHSSDASLKLGQEKLEKLATQNIDLTSYFLKTEQAQKVYSHILSENKEFGIVPQIFFSDAVDKISREGCSKEELDKLKETFKVQLEIINKADLSSAIDKVKSVDEFVKKYKEVTALLPKEAIDNINSTYSGIIINYPEDIKDLSSAAKKDPNSKATLAGVLHRMKNRGNTMPISKEGWTKVNERNLARILLVNKVEPIEALAIIEKFPKDILSRTDLIFEIKNNSLLFRHNGKEGNIKLDSGIQENSKQHHSPKEALKGSDLPHYGKEFFGKENRTTDWVYGKIADVQVALIDADVARQVLNIMKAHDQAKFVINYNPEYWKKFREVDDFPSYFSKAMKEANLTNPVEFKVSTLPANDNNMGYPWTRDAVIQGYDKQGNKVDYTSSDDPSITGNKTYFTDIPVDGGGMYPCGDKIFLSVGFLNRYVSQKFATQIQVDFEGKKYDLTTKFIGANLFNANKSYPAKLVDNLDQQNPLIKTTTVDEFYQFFSEKFPEIKEKESGFKKAIEEQIGKAEIGFEQQGKLVSIDKIKEEFHKNAKEIYGREAVLLGESLGIDDMGLPIQGDSHIDIHSWFLPVKNSDNPIVAIKDFRLGSEILKSLSAEQLKEVEYSMIRHVQKAIRLPDDNKIGNEGLPVYDGISLGFADKFTESKETLSNENYDKISKELNSKGYKTIRFPVIGFMDKEGNQTYFNYSNGFVEISEGKAVVHVPSYGIFPIENYIAKQFTSLGYEVKFFNGMQNCSGDAGPHCLTNETRKN